MKRHIILVSNPHRTPGDPNANFQADNVIKSYISFFKRPEAGYWSVSSEITAHYGADFLSKDDLLLEIDNLNTLDFSILILCGHGAGIAHDDVFGLPGARETISIGEIKSHIKRDAKLLIIFDSCRSTCAPSSSGTAGKITESSDSDNSAYCNACKMYYNQIISSTDSHVELFQSTERGQYAFFTAEGMQYSDVLLSAMNSIADSLPSQMVANKETEKNITIESIHDLTSNVLRGFANPQNPSKISTNGAFSFPAVAVSY